MVLRVGAAGSPPVLTLPKRTPLSAGRAFAEAQEAWLRRHLEARPGPVPVLPGTVLPVLGEDIVLARADSGRLRRSGTALLVPGPEAQLAVRTAAWLKECARGACAARVAQAADVLGRPAGRLSLRDPKSRWGSCNSTGDLMFSWRLVLAPPYVLDYVVAHEVAHLAELNHGARFWDLVARLDPGHRRAQDWLRAEGVRLHAYDFGPRDGAFAQAA